MKINEFNQQVKNAYTKYFPMSRVSVQYSTNLYNDIWINCLLSANNNEVSNGIVQNDVLDVRFQIDTPTGEFPDGLTEDSDMPVNLVLNVHDKTYMIRPENNFLAYSRKTLPFRKVKGNAEKILQYLDKYFLQLKESLIESYASGQFKDGYHISAVRNNVINFL